MAKVAEPDPEIERQTRRTKRKALNLARYTRRYARHRAAPPGRKRTELLYRIGEPFGRGEVRTVDLAPLAGNLFDPRTLAQMLRTLVRPLRSPLMRKPQLPPHQGKAEIARRAAKRRSG